MYRIFPATLTHDNRKVPCKNFRWQIDCTTDQEIINSWQTLYPQMKFYGVPTGTTNNILVLDVDVKDGGLETIKNYYVPLTQSQRTLSGGMHYIFKYPNDGKEYRGRVKFDKGLDIRGEGNYIIYYGTDNTPIAEAPDWLLREALHIEKSTDLSQIAGTSPEIAQGILSEACDNIRNAPPGESNNTLNIESYRIGQLVISNSVDYERAYIELFKAAKDRGKPDYEAEATIKSGLSGGAKNPLQSPFPNTPPCLSIPVLQTVINERWTPPFFTRYDISNQSKLKKPQLFKDWSTEDIHITTADGGTGKTTLKLYEAIMLALGESFLGFECKGPRRTLYITGEDEREKLGAMIGAIMRQMKIIDDKEKVEKILDSIVVKVDNDLCLISKTNQGFIVPNHQAYDKVMQAVEDIRPGLIVFDPIAMFWGSESLLNDMAKAVAKFMGKLVKDSNACVEAINHLGKVSSKEKDITQFAGRGGTGLPSHSRVSKALRQVFDDEYEELTGMHLQDNQAAILCNINKFSDGSPHYNKPFLIIREGYLFSKLELVEQKVREEQNKMSDNERVFTYISEERHANRYPTKNIIVGHFMSLTDKISKERVIRALEMLMYVGHMGEKIKTIDNPDQSMNERSAYVIVDNKGKER